MSVKKDVINAQRRSPWCVPEAKFAEAIPHFRGLEFRLLHLVNQFLVGQAVVVRQFPH